MKSKLLKGTLILTIAGLVTRCIGFFYRIFLNDWLGEEKLGIYQMVFPIYSVCFTIYAMGIQTALSQQVAYGNPKEQKENVKTAILFSLCCSLGLSVLVYVFSPWIATHILHIEQMERLLKILVVLFPFCGVTSIINGFFYGRSNAKYPAASQIIEQLIRVSFVFLFCYFTRKLNVEMALSGLVAGEIAANFFCVYHLNKEHSILQILKAKTNWKPLLSLSVPLTTNRLCIAILNSAESVLIPLMLMRYGMNEENALSLFGIFSGVVLPFLLFPGTITNSLSVLLLPSISKASNTGNNNLLKRSCDLSLRYSLLLGIFTCCIFFYFGKPLGQSLFHSKNAGSLLTLLSGLCPFLYVTTTLTSIINGLGKTMITLWNQTICLALRIVCLVVLVPICGFHGYMIGLFVSQFLLCLLQLHYLTSKKFLSFPMMNYLIWPYIYMFSVFYISKWTMQRLTFHTDSWYMELLAILPATVLSAIYLFKFKLIEKL